MKRKTIKTILISTVFVSSTVLSAGMMPSMDMFDDMKDIIDKDKKKSSSSGMKMPGMGSDMKMPEMPGMGSGSDMKMPEMPDMDSMKDGKMPEMPGFGTNSSSEFEMPGMGSGSDMKMPEMPDMDSMKDGKMPEMPSMDAIKAGKMPDMPGTSVGKDAVEVEKMPTMDNMHFFGKDSKGDKNPMDMMEDMMGTDKKDGGFKMPFFN